MNDLQQKLSEKLGIAKESPKAEIPVEKLKEKEPKTANKLVSEETEEVKIEPKPREYKRFRTGNERLQDAEVSEDVEPLLAELFRTGDVAIIFGDTGLGKTISSMAVGIELSEGKPTVLGLKSAGRAFRVNYYDFELSDQQFQNRYEGYSFSNNLLMCVDVELDQDGNIDIDSFDRDIAANPADVIIVDNISFLSSGSSTETDVAKKIMNTLKGISRKHGVSILVIAHSPKLKPGSRLHINQLSGSKQLSNFADSVFAVGRSKQGADVRYVKQLKFRNTADTGKVYVYKLEKREYLTFVFQGEDYESNHVGKEQQGEGTEDNPKKEEAMRLRVEMGMSIAVIAEKIGVAQSTVGKWLKGVEAGSKSLSKTDLKKV